MTNPQPPGVAELILGYVGAAATKLPVASRKDSHSQAILKFHCCNSFDYRVHYEPQLSTGSLEANEKWGVKIQKWGVKNQFFAQISQLLTKFALFSAKVGSQLIPLPPCFLRPCPIFCYQNHNFFFILGHQCLSK